MPRTVHRIGATIAMSCVVAFFLATVLVELFGSPAAVAGVKSLIVTPGLWVMIPAIATTGASGMFLGKSRQGRLVAAKKRRMPFIAANGLLVLVPCAIVLDRWAAAASFDAAFYVMQTVELIAGAINFALMALNARDGLRLTGRLRALPLSASRGRASARHR